MPPYSDKSPLLITYTVADGGILLCSECPATAIVMAISDKSLGVYCGLELTWDGRQPRLRVA